MALLNQFKLAVLFEARSTNFDPTTARQSRPLEIGVFALHPDGIKLGGPDTVGVFTSHYRPFMANGASFHCVDMLTSLLIYDN